MCKTASGWVSQGKEAGGPSKLKQAVQQPCLACLPCDWQPCPAPASADGELVLSSPEAHPDTPVVATQDALTAANPARPLGETSRLLPCLILTIAPLVCTLFFLVASVRLLLVTGPRADTPTMCLARSRAHVWCMQCWQPGFDTELEALCAPVSLAHLRPAASETAFLAPPNHSSRHASQPRPSSDRRSALSAGASPSPAPRPASPATDGAAGPDGPPLQPSHPAPHCSVTFGCGRRVGPPSCAGLCVPVLSGFCSWPGVSRALHRFAGHTRREFG